MQTLSNEEYIGLTVVIGAVVLIFFGGLGGLFNTPQRAVDAPAPGVVNLDPRADTNTSTRLLQGEVGPDGQLKNIIISDTTLGTGEAVRNGDTVTVHYVGTFVDGTQFDASTNREPLTFTVGSGDVIDGWEEGIIGMRKGGERVLVIPPQKAYGARGTRAIPPHSTLLFSLTLLNVQ
jgi:hypothetical protein